MPPRRAVRTYLQMTDPNALLPSDPPSDAVALARVDHCPPALWRQLYTEVGRQYHWVDRLQWTDEEIAHYLSDAALELWLL